MQLDATWITVILYATNMTMIIHLGCLSDLKWIEIYEFYIFVVVLNMNLIMHKISEKGWQPAKYF